MVKIAVLIKQVPSSEARIRVAADGRSIDPADVEYGVNVYDEYAMEAALQTKEKHGGEVVVLALGGPKVEEALRTCLALGADRAVVLRDEAFAGGDSLGTARVLSAALRKEAPDLILCGKLSIDEENFAVGPQVAELLDLPHASVLSHLEVPDPKHVTAKREIEGGMEELEIELPAVLTANKGLNEPRYASLKGIMMAKKKPMETLDAAGLGLDPATVGAQAAQVSIVAMEPPPERSGGRLFEGAAKDVVPEVVRLLKEEAKVL